MWLFHNHTLWKHCLIGPIKYKNYIRRHLKEMQILVLWIINFDFTIYLIALRVFNPKARKTQLSTWLVSTRKYRVNLETLASDPQSQCLTSIRLRSNTNTKVRYAKPDSLPDRFLGCKGLKSRFSLRSITRKGSRRGHFESKSKATYAGLVRSREEPGANGVHWFWKSSHF